MAALFNNSTFSMKPRIDSATDVDRRRAAAKRTALIVGVIAVMLFVLSIVEVVLSK
jgi:hypothetical protein